MVDKDGGYFSFQEFYRCSYKRALQIFRSGIVSCCEAQVASSK